MLGFLTPLELIVPCPLPQTGGQANVESTRSIRRRNSLSQPLLKFLLPFPLLKLLASFPLLVQALFAAPLVPSDFFHLLPEEQHHVAVGRCVRVGPQEMGEEILVFELWVGEEVVLEVSIGLRVPHSPLYTPSLSRGSISLETVSCTWHTRACQIPGLVSISTCARDLPLRTDGLSPSYCTLYTGAKCRSG